MSEFGSDDFISISASQDLAYTKFFADLNEVWVLQWTVADEQASRLLSNRKHNIKCVFLIQQ